MAIQQTVASSTGTIVPPNNMRVGPSLLELFTEYSRNNTRKSLIVRSGGNWGDHLIYYGAEYLAKKAGLQYDLLSYEEFVSRDPNDFGLIYIHGGGGYNSWCSGRVLKAFEHAVSGCLGIVIQGPQTFADDPAYQRQFAQRISAAARARRVCVFTREETSYRGLRNHVPESIELFLTEDTAFSVPVEELRQISHGCRQRLHLVILREDNEVPTETSAKQTIVSLDPAEFAQSFEHWIRIHASARSIVTNRTHSAIIGALLGIPTTIMPGSYHKNRSIWEHSLRHRGVAWAETVPTATTLQRCMGGIERLSRRSTKLHRLFWVLNGAPLH